MEPTIKDLEIKKTLNNVITANGKEITEINIKKLIIRPVLKRIVFNTAELDRVIVYEGETDFDAHKDDSDEILIAKLLTVIAAKYPA